MPAAVYACKPMRTALLLSSLLLWVCLPSAVSSAILHCEECKRLRGQNHSAARNYFLSGMRKLADAVCEVHGESKDQVERIALDPRFQEAVADIIEEQGIKL